MKRFLSAIFAVIMIFVLVGCSKPADNTIPATPTESTSPNYSITDYTLTPMLNTTSADFCALTNRGWEQVDPTSGTATAICVDVICPVCHYETFITIEFSDISQNLIGQQSFTWQKELGCNDWAKHADPFSDKYTCAILFTLNK